MSMSEINEQIFQDCLSLLEKGHTIDEVAGKYPEIAAELRAFLLSSRAVHQYGSGILVPAAARSRSRSRFLQAAQAAQNEKILLPVPSTNRFKPLRMPLYLRAAFVVFLILAFAGGLGAIKVSASAVPGDVLYPIKRAAERTQLMFERDINQRLQLEKSFDEERISEMQTLTSRSRSAVPIEFGGAVQSIDHIWQINNVRTLIDGQTQIDENITLGDYVNVLGTLLSDGSVLANRIQSEKVAVQGIIYAIGADSWKIADVDVKIGSQTHISGTPRVGVEAAVEALVLGDRSLLALNIRVNNTTVEQVVEPSDTLEARNTQFEPSDGETAESTRHENPSVTPRPRPTDAPEPTNEEQPTQEVEPTHTPKPTKTSEPTSTEEEHNNPGPGETEQPHNTSTLTPTATSTPTPTGTYWVTPTRRPRRSPTPTLTPTKSRDHED